MAALPGWLVQEGTVRDGATLTVRVRSWHPSFGAMLWGALTVTPTWIKPAVWLWTWARCLRELRDPPNA